MASSPWMALDAAQSAVDLTRRRLFPFQLERWMVLGFLAFLDQLCRGGGWGSNGAQTAARGSRGSEGGGEVAAALAAAVAWVKAHLALLLAIAVPIVLLALALGILLLWLNSRGTFMYLDCVATGRVEIRRPWREHAERAWSYFLWCLGVAMAALVVLLPLVLGIVATVLRMVTGGVSPGLVAGLLLLGLATLVAVCLLGLVSLALRDFAAPLQLAGARTCGEALAAVGADVRRAPAAFAVYVLLKCAFAIALAMIATLAGCLTCCIGFLPVVAQTILQPAYYFERAWSIEMLRRLGREMPGEVATPVV